MNGSTGPGGRILAITPYGNYSVPERYADRRMPTIYQLADFLWAGTKATAWWDVARLLQVMVAATPEARQLLRETHPREDAALYHWQNLSPLYPITDAHGPTMRQLLEALNRETS